jgi:hypothetical protein
MKTLTYKQASKELEDALETSSHQWRKHTYAQYADGFIAALNVSGLITPDVAKKLREQWGM